MRSSGRLLRSIGSWRWSTTAGSGFRLGSCRRALFSVEDDLQSGRMLVARWMSSSYPEHTLIEMPKLSPTMETGNIVQWNKKESDEFEVGETLAEIETDKATVDLDATDEGFIAKILVTEGSQDVKIGTPIAVSVLEQKDIEAFKDFTLDGTEEKPASSEKQSKEKEAPKKEQSSKASGGSYPEHTIIEMPKLSPSMTSGNLISWKIKEGDHVDVGDEIAELETDKSVMAFESNDEGYLAKILVPEDSKDVPLGQAIAIFTDEPVDSSAFDGFELGTDSSPTAEVDESPQHEKESKSDRAASDADFEVESKPPEKVKDEPKKPEPIRNPQVQPNDGSFEVLEMTQFRKVTAQRLLESKRNIPHYYLAIECCVDDMLAQRSVINGKLKEGDKKISVNDYILKACAVALQKVPEVNAQWAESSIRQMHNIDLSVAVQTERGLITPIVKDADRKGLKAIAKEVRSLADKAKAGKLLPEEFMGGTFTVSNLGMYGVDGFSAVINPPQAAILAVGGTEKKVIPAGNDEFKEKSYMTVTLSCDHRVVDGAIGARWLAAFKDNIEDPLNML
eukprot:Plantae.Rhodophyta-Purpureofilum_apyrenoidigerum.ctg5571.p1 GENE.Plantae.Rhodophyta-Purpureofilum_apyrenoidigerum.ctg5571~~Plantae.Rhodophyta-Purpureofilum_apyrenoidigerum.ctg5571.p1  ORF type:complete len:564 (+),score=137.71 Plantae.Rhodophyta-Purpureofilum_apyrenoidigerum.ctg5571:137-1828(+)